MFKFHLVIPLIAILVLRKKFRVALGFVAVSFILFAISLAMVHWSGMLAYPRYLLELNPGLGMVKPQRMPNVRGLMTVFLGHDPLHPLAKWFLAGVVVFGVFIGRKYWRGADRQSLIMAFSFAIVVTLLTSYYANIYDLTLLLLPLLLLGRTFSGSNFCGWPRAVFLSAAAVLLFTPFLWVLALRVDRFGLVTLVLLALAWSISAAEKSWQPV
jgi:hypothetical protein